MKNIYFKSLLLNLWLLVTFSSSAQIISTDPTPYCTTNFSFTPCSVNDYIDNFTFNTLSNLASGCLPTAPFYAMYAQTTTVMPGVSYPLSVQGNLTKPNGYGVWIDYNQNNSFADLGEFVFVTNTIPGAGFLYTTTIAIPPSATPGVTRLRVRGNWNNSPAPFIQADACGNYAGWGETEDYIITIGGSSAGPVTVPPIASYAYSDMDTVWISSPKTVVNTSNGADFSYWDVMSYNASNKYGFYTALTLPRVLKNSNGINDYFLDTIENKVNLNQYIFDNPGYYRVKLVASNRFGFDTYIDTLYVDTPSSPPTAEFFADRRTIGVYDYANMFDLTGNGPVSWQWYLDPPFYSPGAPFFNNFSPTAGDQNPALNANEGGIFDVCLVATNYRGSDTVCKSDYMKIISGYEVCKGTSTAKDTIAKENEGSAKLATVAGLYIPSLIGTCSKGFSISTCSDTVTLFIDRFKMRPIDSLRVHEGDKSGPIVARYGGSVIPAAFSTVKVKGGIAFLETFLGSSTGAGDSGYVVRWNASPATYPKPTAAFSLADTIYDGYTAQYTNQSTGKNVKYAWDTNGDNVYGIDNPSSGVDSTTTNPSRTFNVFLPYTANICLKASNCVGSDTACKSGKVPANYCSTFS
jgi:PKD repeat protein